MSALLLRLLGPIGAKLAGLAALVGTALAAFLAIRQSGRNAERVDNLETLAEVKDAQQKAAADAPRDRPAVSGSMRKGEF